MFNLADYETVEERLIKFWKDNPDGQIHTKLLSNTPTQFVVEAAIYRTEADARPWTTGLAEETVQARGVNSTSALENCETSAIGRALANAGYATKGKRASREEMTKVAGAAKVKTEIAEVKAKMAETSKQYVPVPVEDDVWTVREATPPATSEQAINLLKDVLGATTEKDIPRCPHGEMMWRTGTSKAGKPWGQMKCPNAVTGESGRCEKGLDVIWYEILPSGTWAPQKVKF